MAKGLAEGKGRGGISREAPKGISQVDGLPQPLELANSADQLGGEMFDFGLVAGRSSRSEVGLEGITAHTVGFSVDAGGNGPDRSHSLVVPSVF